MTTTEIDIVITTPGKAHLQIDGTCPGCDQDIEGMEVTDVSLVNYFYYGYRIVDGEVVNDPYDSKSAEVEGTVDIQCASCGTSLLVEPEATNE